MYIFHKIIESDAKCLIPNKLNSILFTMIFDRYKVYMWDTRILKKLILN